MARVVRLLTLGVAVVSLPTPAANLEVEVLLLAVLAALRAQTRMLWIVQLEEEATALLMLEPDGLALEAVDQPFL